MNRNEYSNLPAIVQDFLEYHTLARGHSENTVRGYAIDMGLLLTVVAERHGLNEASVAAADAEFFRSITLDDLYAYQSYAASTPPSASTRCRRTSSVKSFFHYLLAKRHILDKDISLELDMPKRPVSLPAFLEADECEKVLNACTGANAVRDRAILTLFMSCGLRVSELASLDLKDVRADHVRVRGKGDKERIVYFGDGCRKAMAAWLIQRESIEIVPEDSNAVFISRDHRRIGVRAINNMVKSRIADAGMDADRFSPHKLRHTAATLMLKNGVDTRVLQEVLGHSSLTTTQIYVHVTSASLRAAAMANPIGA